MNFYVINRKGIGKVLMVGLFIIAAVIWYSFQAKVIPVFHAQDGEMIRDIHIVTNEITSRTEDGKEIEIYRFDPGTIFIKKGEKVQLRLFGVKGKEHSFIIERTDIQGTVKKGKETVVSVRFANEGIYRLICLNHQDYEHNGPMIAYIVVE